MTKAEAKKIRGKLLEDLEAKNNMVKGFEIELGRVKRELAEEKQKRGNEVVALEQENATEIMENAMKDQQIRALQRTLGAKREELVHVRASNEQNKEKLKAAEGRKNMYKEEKERLAKEKEDIERNMNKMLEGEREMRKQLEQQIGY